MHKITIPSGITVKHAKRLLVAAAAANKAMNKAAIEWNRVLRSDSALHRLEAESGNVPLVRASVYEGHRKLSHKHRRHRWGIPLWHEWLCGKPGCRYENFGGTPHLFCSHTQDPRRPVIMRTAVRGQIVDSPYYRTDVVERYLRMTKYTCSDLEQHRSCMDDIEMRMSRKPWATKTRRRDLWFRARFAMPADGAWINGALVTGITTERLEIMRSLNALMTTVECSISMSIPSKAVDGSS